MPLEVPDMSRVDEILKPLTVRFDYFLIALRDGTFFDFFHEAPIV
jgi:hypothetical protein